MAGDAGGSGGGFRQRLRRELGLGVEHEAGDADPVERAAAVVRTYGADGYTGAAFDTYSTNDPGAITSDDLIALTMLSIHIRQQSTSSLRPSSILALDSVSDRITEALRQVPADRELHTLTESEFQRWLGPGSPGDQLYWLLRKQASIPRVAVYKLLARKRPSLMPIRDTVVERALGHKADPWWRPWWETLAGDPEVVSHLGDIRRRSGAVHLSLLRVADIMLWMTHRPSKGAIEDG
jgi:hypothetical protein